MKGFRVVLAIVLLGVFWTMAVKPLIAEHMVYKYKKTNKQEYILAAVKFDANSTNNFKASLSYAKELNVKASEAVNQAIAHFDGDLTPWSIWHYKGLISFRSGHVNQARADFGRALYYWPEFAPSKIWLTRVNEIIKTHEKIVVKIR